MENSLQQSFDGEKCAVGLSVPQNSEGKKKKKDEEKNEEGKRETICIFQKFLTHTVHCCCSEGPFLLSPPLLCNQIVPKLPLG